MRLLLSGCAALALAACDFADDDYHYPGEPSALLPLVGEIEVPPPPFTEGAFPCSDCHDPEITPNTERRELTMAHEEIVLHHDEANRWCHDCHSAKDFDKLHLASGELIDFTESFRLCGQCHGDKYRDWRAGIHGRRSGQWNGKKTYLLCVHCHSSHAPAFELRYVPGFKPDDPKSDKPMAAPVRPGDLRRQQNNGDAK